MKPSIGRIVLVQVAGAEVLPAIVTKVNEPREGGETLSIDVEVFGLLPPHPGTSDDDRAFDEAVDARFLIHLHEGTPGEVGRWFWPIREVTS